MRLRAISAWRTPSAKKAAGGPWTSELIVCEFALSRCWSKEAEAVLDNGKRLPWEPVTQR